MGKEEFKKAFFAGELIWLSGAGRDVEGALLELLEQMKVRSSCVEFTDPDRWLSGMDRLLESGEIEVLVVRLDSPPGRVGRSRLREVLRDLLEKQCEMGFRVLLVSSERDPEWVRELEGFSPREWAFPFPEAEASLDDAVHGLIEMASRHAEVRVSRLSERAAFFLEESVKSRVDGDLVALVVLGLKRSDGRVLRFRDLLPHFHRYFDGGDRGENV